MNKRNIISLLLLFAIIGLAVGVFLEQRPAKKELSKDDILQAVVGEMPAFSNHGKPVIAIDSFSKYDDKWYIVTIKSLHTTKTFVPVKLVLMDQGEPDHKLKTVLGPDVHFTDSQMSALNLPDSVILDLQRP